MRAHAAGAERARRGDRDERRGRLDPPAPAPLRDLPGDRPRHALLAHAAARAAAAVRLAGAALSRSDVAVYSASNGGGRFGPAAAVFGLCLGGGGGRRVRDERRAAGAADHRPLAERAKAGPAEAGGGEEAATRRTRPAREGDADATPRVVATATATPQRVKAKPARKHARRDEARRWRPSARHGSSASRAPAASARRRRRGRRPGGGRAGVRRRAAAAEVEGRSASAASARRRRRPERRRVRLRGRRGHARDRSGTWTSAGLTEYLTPLLRPGRGARARGARDERAPERDDAVAPRPGRVADAAGADARRARGARGRHVHRLRGDLHRARARRRRAATCLEVDPEFAEVARANVAPRASPTG